MVFVADALLRARPLVLLARALLRGRGWWNGFKDICFWWRSALPTFLYAMPFSPTRVFLEETSLVARPAVGFPELRARLRKRLAHMGVVVTAIEEEEYCLIPMGGVLPRLPQRVLGIGGTAGMVHPSTGAPASAPVRHDCAQHWLREAQASAPARSWTWAAWRGLRLELQTPALPWNRAQEVLCHVACRPHGSAHAALRPRRRPRWAQLRAKGQLMHRARTVERTRFLQGSAHNAVWRCAGYMVSRMLGAAPVLADAAVEALCRGRDAAADAHRPLGAASEPEAEALSAAVWHAIWPVERCGSHARPKPGICAVPSPCSGDLERVWGVLWRCSG